MISSQLLHAAHDAWCAAAALRQRRARMHRYTFGDQWGDPVVDNHGRTVREEDLIRASGRKPLTNNLIRRLVTSVIGRYRHDRAAQKRPAGVPPEVEAFNDLTELDARMLEEYLISGMAIQRVARERHRGCERLRVTNVNPDRFFCNRFSDPRGHDIEMAGMLHDMSLHEILSRFGHNDRRRMQSIRNWYALEGEPGAHLPGSESDFFAAPAGRCRVIEMWTLEAIEAVRRQRCDITFGWRCRWLTPSGETLASYFSPWAHAMHPFVIKFYPMADGEVHPFVEDVIDQQRYINRLIVLIDRMMGASAKGVLLFPVDQLLPGMDWKDVADRWSATDAIIPIRGRSAQMPQQITGSGADAGAHKLLELELKLFEDVSGVSNALLGKTDSANAGSALFESQVANATIALADIFDTFNAFIAERDDRIAHT